MLAGEYPGSRSRAATLERLRRLLDAGINYFLDLTEPGELPAYDVFLPAGAGPNGRYIEYVRKPLRDHGVPDEPQMMVEILDRLGRALAEGHRVYLHCRAGIGRTGTVLGCHLIQCGMAPDEALDRLQLLWESNGRSRIWPQTPETDEQVEYVRSWRPALQKASAAIVKSHLPLHDRYLGALLGLAIGDALGAGVQGRAPGTFEPVADLAGGGPFDLPRGAWSDDTAMALCLAESLLERHGFDAADQMARYRRWQREGYMSSTGRCVGLTPSVTRALATAQWTGKPYAGSHDPNQLDKEPLVRVASVALYFSQRPSEAVELAAEAARTTHQSPAVLDACRYFAALLLAALQGTDKQALLGTGYTPLRAPIAAVAAGSFRNKQPPQIEGGGTVVQALEAVLWALHASDNFREGALLAVNLGLDADVTGALYGQLAGALYGASAIPPYWLDALVKRPLIEDFAGRLFKKASGNP